MTAVETPTTGYIGTRMLRCEDARLLTGEAKYTADLDIPGALHLAVLRSPDAHTGADLREQWATPMPCAWAVTEDMRNPEHFPVAVGSVNYVGDAVAVVL